MPSSTSTPATRSPTSSARTATTTIHAVSIAAELGDAGQAIELAQQVDPGNLSPERQARYYLDLAQAHTMRRQIGEALHAPQESRTHRP